VYEIEGVAVPITSAAKTVIDLFRYRQTAGRRFKSSPGLNLALEGLREALRQRKATPAEIASGLTPALALNEYKVPDRSVVFHGIHPWPSPRIDERSAYPVAGFYSATRQHFAAAPLA